MSRYAWLTNSQDHSGAIPTTPDVVYLDIPAGTTLKRFQLRNCYISMQSQNPDFSHVLSPMQSITIDYIPEFAVPRTIYSSIRRIPFESNVFVETAIPIVNYQASAGDLELGVDQQCSYGLLSGPIATLRLTTYIYAYPFLPNDFLGDWQYEFAALTFH